MVASQNPDKIQEVEDVLAAIPNTFEVVRGLEWPEVDEPYETLTENALHKAQAVVAATGIAALADDTGLEVAALGGRPGVHTARYAGPDAVYADNVAKLLMDMDGVEDRRATFRTVVALARLDGSHALAEGILQGRIAFSPRGSGGFGYDPVFEVAEYDYRTLAEVPEGVKNRISHRARALRALVEALTEVEPGL